MLWCKLMRMRILVKLVVLKDLKNANGSQMNKLLYRQELREEERIIIGSNEGISKVYREIYKLITITLNF